MYYAKLETVLSGEFSLVNIHRTVSGSISFMCNLFQCNRASVRIDANKTVANFFQCFLNTNSLRDQ